MKNTFKVFRFELMSTLKKKSFIVTTLILLAITILLGAAPKVFGLFKNDDVEETGTAIEAVDATDLKELGIVYGNMDREGINAIAGEMQISLVQFDDVKDLEAAVMSGELEEGIVVNSPNDVEVIVETLGMYSNFGDVESLFKEYNTRIAFIDAGIDYNMVKEISNIPVKIESRAIGVDGTNSFFMVYVMIFVIYFLILIFGQQVATSVAKEKSDRTMEILITSTSATSLINGKVFAAAVLGIFQMAVLALGTGIALYINKDILGMFTSFINFNIDLNVFAIYLVFFVFGYLLYLYLFAALGALVSKVEEVGASVTPITILFVLSFFAAMTGLNAPEAFFVKVASFIPFSSLMTMFVRYALATVPMMEVLISLGILVVTTIVMAMISIRIYRMGTLNYGNKMKFFSSLKKNI